MNHHDDENGGGSLQTDTPPPPTNQININAKQNVESRFTVISFPASPDVKMQHNDLEALNVALGTLPSTLNFEASSSDPNNFSFVVRDYMSNGIIAKGQVDKRSGELSLTSTTNGTVLFNIKNIPTTEVESSDYKGLPRTYNIFHGNQLIGTIIEPKWDKNIYSSALNQSTTMAKMSKIYKETSTYSIKFVTKEDLMVLKTNPSSSSPSKLCKIHIPFVQVDPLAYSKPFDAVLSFPEQPPIISLSNIDKCLCLAVPIVLMTARNVLPTALQEEALKINVGDKADKFDGYIGYIFGILLLGVIIFILVLVLRYLQIV